jgi:hypothetical protein
MEKRQQLEALEGHGRLVWPGHSLPVRYDVTVNQYQDVGADGTVRLTEHIVEARVEAADQSVLALTNGREDVVLEMEGGRQLPCTLREAQGSAGWLIGTDVSSS